MKEIVINSCYGGFGLSLVAEKEYAKRKGFDLFFYKTTKYEHRDGHNEYQRVDDLSDSDIFTYSLKRDLGAVSRTLPKGSDDWFHGRDIPRDDADLIAVVKELGEKANGQCAKLRIVEIPDDVNFEIEEYDGNEWVAESHRTWN